VEVNPNQLKRLRISLETIRRSLQMANANLAKGSVSDSTRMSTIADTDQLFKAYEYQPLIVADTWRPGASADIAQVEDSVEDTRNLGPPIISLP